MCRLLATGASTGDASPDLEERTYRKGRGRGVGEQKEKTGREEGAPPAAARTRTRGRSREGEHMRWFGNERLGEKRDRGERITLVFFLSVLPIIIFNYHVSRVFDSISGNEQK